MSLYYEQRGIDVEPTILMMAFRYALGRQTYAPIIIADGIRDNIGKLSTDHLEIMSDQIMASKAIGKLGDECDIRTWTNLHDLIEKELERRGHENEGS